MRSPGSFGRRPTRQRPVPYSAPPRPALPRLGRPAARAGAPGLGERVLDADRHFGVDGAAHEPVPFGPAQSLGEHLLRDALNASAQLREAGVAVPEGTHDEYRPAVSNAVQDAAGRAVRAVGTAVEHRSGWAGYHKVPSSHWGAALIR